MLGWLWGVALIGLVWDVAVVARRAVLFAVWWAVVCVVGCDGGRGVRRYLLRRQRQVLISARWAVLYAVLWAVLYAVLCAVCCAVLCS